MTKNFINKCVSQRFFAFIFLCVITSGISVSSFAEPTNSVPYEAEFTDGEMNHVRVIVKDPTKGISIYINEEHKFIQGEIKTLSLPGDKHLTSFAEDVVLKVLGANSAPNNAIMLVGGNLVVVADGKVQTFPFPDSLLLSQGADFEVVTPEVSEKSAPVTFFRLSDPTQDILRTLLIVDSNVYEVSGFSSEEEISRALHYRGTSITRINGVPVEITKIIDEIPSFKNRKVIDFNPRVERLLNHPALGGIFIKEHNRGEPTKLSTFLQNHFTIIKKVELRSDAIELYKGELDRGIVGLTMRQGGGVRITGRPGTGKTFLANLMVTHIYSSPGLEDLKNSIFISLDASSLVAGTSYVGEFENKVQALVDLSEVIPLVLMIDEMHTLVGAGTHSQSSIDFFQKIKSALESGRLKIIGTTTEAEWSKYFSNDRALAERFPVAIQVKVPNRENTLKIMRSSLEHGYSNLNSAFSDADLAVLYDYSEQYDAVGANPRKALRLLDYMAARAKAKQQTNISKDDLLFGASEFYQFDIAKLTPESLRRSLLSLRTYLDQNLAGMEEPKDAISTVLADHFLHQLSGNSRTPTAVMLYGDRGVGKTVFATQVAKGLGYDFKRLMMASYSGFGGAEEFKRALAMAIRANPFSVILLDEIEKAPPAVQQVLLQVLDEGRFEANLSEQGEKISMTEVDASKVVFMSATNAAKHLADMPGVTSDMFEAQAEMDGLNRYVLDRHSKFIAMKSPRGDNLRDILTLKLKGTLNRFKGSGYTLDLDQAAVINYLLKRVSSESSEGRTPIGFGTAAGEAEAMSVRRLERELKDLERAISEYILKNQDAKVIQVKPSAQGLEVSGDSNCESGFIKLK